MNLFRTISRLPIRSTIAAVVVMAVLAVLAAQEPRPPADVDATNRIFVGQPDGSGMKLVVDLPDYTAQGSPCWSQDGKLIVFDAWRPKLNETNTDSKIILVNADGSDPKILGDGAMPSFSPRHRRIAFSRYEPNIGVWVMSVEGPEKELVLLDEEGWSARWSPDGTRILYTVGEEDRSNLVVYDLIEGVRIPLFEAGKSPYLSFFWNFSWSPDGRRIAFKGERIDNEKLEVGIVDARGAKYGLVSRHESNQIANIAWTHDSKRVLFAQQSPAQKNRMQVFTLDAQSMDPPVALPNQDVERGNSGAVESPDGKRLLMVSRKPPAKAVGKKKKAK
jgi:TolB protein